WSFHDFGRLPVEERVLLDYVFVTKGAKIDRYRVIQDKPENSYLSDHCPILVELTVQ
ncbi:MAG TPA: endonuclease, partial [Bacteroides uniformis]|nr:endonuclease [Bacteroides uniformis]